LLCLFIHLLISFFVSLLIDRKQNRDWSALEFESLKRLETSLLHSAQVLLRDGQQPARTAPPCGNLKDSHHGRRIPSFSGAEAGRYAPRVILALAQAAVLSFVSIEDKLIPQFSPDYCRF